MHETRTDIAESQKGGPGCCTSLVHAKDSIGKG
jgi:hypothetical protein